MELKGGLTMNTRELLDEIITAVESTRDFYSSDGDYDNGGKDACECMLRFLNDLHIEKPKEDAEKEIERRIKNWRDDYDDVGRRFVYDGSGATTGCVKEEMLYFYEYGMNKAIKAFEEEIEHHRCPEHGYFCDCLDEVVEKLKGKQS